MHNVLIYVFLVLIVTNHSKCLCKSNFLKKYRYSAEEPVILVRSWSTLFITFQNVSCPDSSCFIWFVTINPKCMCKNQVFMNFQALRERTSDTGSF